MIKLSNNNITLRALEPNDVELLYKWENDPEVWKVSNSRVPFSKFILANYIKSSDRDIWESKELRLIIDDAEGVSVGSVELFDFEPYHNRVGVGVIVFDSNNRRKGIAFEALELLHDYAKNDLGIFQMYANIAESNKSSILLFSKLDYELIGTKKRWLRVAAGFENELMFQKFL